MNFYNLTANEKKYIANIGDDDGLQRLLVYTEKHTSIVFNETVRVELNGDKYVFMFTKSAERINCISSRLSNESKCRHADDDESSFSILEHAVRRLA